MVSARALVSMSASLQNSMPVHAIVPRRNADGRTVNHTLGIASLGGATMDNEENYLIKKLFGGGLGMVNIENQARI